MPYLGKLLIYSSTLAAAISALLYFLTWRGRENLRTLARSFFRLAVASVTLTLGILLYLILTHDYSVMYVYSYSSNDLPLYYLISSLWGGQEGTFLLWIFMAGVMGLIMLRSAKNFEAGNMFFLNLFILSVLFILLKKSPFELMPVFKADGAGLNPLLQNYWMTIHPPIMFVGFAGAVIPFCFAMTALVEKRFNLWAEAARKWTIFAWAALGISLTMGGYWAYETLGWGGFWAWDPVENSSFIPWIFLTAQVHSLFIKRRRQGLMRFSLFIVLLTFWSVLYGTFLTRSGVLADFSVHSFVDLGINNFLIGGLLFFFLLGGSLLIMRWQHIKPEPSFSSVSSRAYMVTLGIIILFVGGVLVLLGTSAPLLTRLTDNPSAVGLPYYFATMTPIAAAVMILIGLFPVFRWQSGISRPKLLMVGTGIGLVTATTLMILGVTFNPLYLVLFGAAAWALAVNSYAVYMTWREGQIKPGYLAHIGLALAMIGAAASAGFETKQAVRLPQGQNVQAMGYSLNFDHAADTPKGFDCHVNIEGGGEKFVAVLPHEFPKNAEGVMRKPYVEKHLGFDLYVAPVGMEQPEGADPGVFSLEDGDSKSIDKYSFTFNGFELDSHGEEGMPTQAAADITVEYDGQSEAIRPSLVVQGESVQPLIAKFDNGKGAISITGVHPESGGVSLQVTGMFVPPPVESAAILTIELSRKPLINLFWLGTIMMFASGLWSMRQRRARQRRERQVSQAETAVDQKSRALAG